MQPPVGPVTPLTYISRDAQGHLANLNAGPLALRIRLYQYGCATGYGPCEPCAFNGCKIGLQPIMPNGSIVTPSGAD